jgi:hypothetical protein
MSSARGARAYAKGAKARWQYVPDRKKFAMMKHNRETRGESSMELALLALLALSTCSLSVVFIGTCFLSLATYFL